MRSTVADIRTRLKTMQAYGRALPEVVAVLLEGPAPTDATCFTTPGYQIYSSERVWYLQVIGEVSEVSCRISGDGKSFTPDLHEDPCLFLRAMHALLAQQVDYLRKRWLKETEAVADALGIAQPNYPWITLFPSPIPYETGRFQYLKDLALFTESEWQRLTEDIQALPMSGVFSGEEEAGLVLPGPFTLATVDSLLAWLDLYEQRRNAYVRKLREDLARFE